MRIRLIILALVLGATSTVFAQGPRGNAFGFGIILGEPTGGTIKYWVNQESALTASIGSSYFGNLRIGADYIWHFDAFNSNVVKLYAGPGAVVGIGNGHGVIIVNRHDEWYYRESDFGFGIRAIFGLNIVPRRTPLEIFLEAGPLIGISPAFGAAFEGAIGVRFYP